MKAKKKIFEHCSALPDVFFVWPDVLFSQPGAAMQQQKIMYFLILHLNNACMLPGRSKRVSAEIRKTGFPQTAFYWDP